MKILFMLTDNWTNPIQYSNPAELVRYVREHIGNTGNLMFMHACKYFAELENEVNFYDWHEMQDNPKKYKEKINAEYDLVIYPAANMFQSNTVHLQNVSNLLKGITIPIYIIGAGITTHPGETIESLCTCISNPSKELFDIIGNSNGKITCRGYYTKELLDKLGAANISLVTGCPSMYQNGLLHINKATSLPSSAHIGVNGKIIDLENNKIRNTFCAYPSTYICQDEYLPLLYSSSYDANTLISKYTYPGLKLVCEQNVKIFYNLPTWFSYVKNEIDFMLGSRIHGNLIALLGQVPAAVYLPKTYDLRVLELAEYFCIPTITEKMLEKKSITTLYEELNYTSFNTNFPQIFDSFSAFLKDSGICKNLPITPNPQLVATVPTQEPFCIQETELQQSIRKAHPILSKLYHI